MYAVAVFSLLLLLLFIFLSVYARLYSTRPTLIATIPNTYDDHFILFVCSCMRALSASVFSLANSSLCLFLYYICIVAGIISFFSFVSISMVLLVNSMVSLVYVRAALYFAKIKTNLVRTHADT